MPQAALATLALLLATLYSMQRQRAIFDGQMRMVANEMEMMATSVAKDELERIGVTAFDEAVIDPETGAIRRLTSPTQLTTKVNFRLEGSEWNDLDDFQKVAGADSTFRARTVSGQTFRFYTYADVAYVNEGDGRTPSAWPTRTKQVTVFVRPVTIETGETIRLQQTYTCGSACAW